MGTDFFATFLFPPFPPVQLYLPVSTGSSQGYTSAMIPKTQFNFFPTSCFLPELSPSSISLQSTFSNSTTFCYQAAILPITSVFAYLQLEFKVWIRANHTTETKCLYELFWIHTVCTGSRSNKQLQGMQPIPTSLILLSWLNLNSKFFSLHAVISSSLFGNRQKSPFWQGAHKPEVYLFIHNSVAGQPHCIRLSDKSSKILTLIRFVETIIR